MTDRVNLVDAYSNRSVIAKLVGMEERIDGAESEMQADLDSAKEQVTLATAQATASANSATASADSATSAKESADSAASVLDNAVKKSGQTSQTIAGDITVTGEITMEGDQLTAGNMAIEKSGTATVLSNSNGINVNGHNLNNVMTTDEDQSTRNAKTFVTTYSKDLVILKGDNFSTEATSYQASMARIASVDKNDNEIWRLSSIMNSNGRTGAVFEVPNGRVIIPTPAGVDSTDAAVNVAYVSDTTGNLNNLVHTAGDEAVAGDKKFSGVVADDTYVVRSKYYSVASGSRDATPWRLLYTDSASVSTASNHILTLAYSGSRAGAVGGAYPAILTIIKLNASVECFGLGSSAASAFRVIYADGTVYVYGYASNRHSGSASTIINALGGRNENYWTKEAEENYYSITDGTVTDSSGTVIIEGTAVTINTE